MDAEGANRGNNRAMLLEDESYARSGEGTDVDDLRTEQKRDWEVAEQWLHPRQAISKQVL